MSYYARLHHATEVWKRFQFTVPGEIWKSNSQRVEKLGFETFIQVVSVQMFSFDIFLYLNRFNLFETNVTQSIKPMNYVYHARLITPAPYCAWEI